MTAQCVRAHLGQSAEGGGTEVDRGLPATRGGCPGSLQELLTRLDQVVGAPPHSLRVAGQHCAVSGQ